MAGYIGSKASVVSSGAERKTVITATSGQTSLTGLSYTPTKVHVFQNGVRLVDGTDYTATNGSSITLTVGASTNDQIVVVSYATVEISDAVPASSGGTFSGNVVVNNTLTTTNIKATGETNSRAVSGVAASWMSLNGDTATIRDSQNVASITDNGTGDYTTNFSNNMGNTNYGTSGSCCGAGSANGSTNVLLINSSAHNSLSAPLAGSFRSVCIHDANVVKQDVDYLTLTAHGDLA